MSKKYRLKVLGITCSSCTNSIEKALKNILKTALISFDSNIAHETITVKVDDRIDRAKLNEIIEDAGFEVASVSEVEQLHHHQSAKQSLTPYLVKAGVAGTVGLVLLILSLVGLVIPLFGQIIMCFLTLPIMIYASHHIFRNAYKAFRVRSFNMDTLFSISIAVVFIASIISMAVPMLGIPLFFSAALLIPAFRCLGIAIDKKSKRAVMTERHFIDRAPTDVTTIANTNQLNPATTVRKICELEVGALIKVSAGQMIPLDGEIVKGQGEVLQKIWSGDHHPRQMSAAQQVLAGMELNSGELIIRVTKDYQNSLLARLDKNIINAQGSKPEIEKLTSKVVKYFVPAVVIIAIISAVFISVFISPITAISTSISVLCVACPCVFGWLVPLTSQLAIAKGAKHNAYFANAEAIQTLCKVDTVVFDKTGTLTEPKICALEDFKYTTQEIMAIAATLEQGSDHVYAKAVVDLAQQQNINNIVNASNIEDKHKLGRSGIINDQAYLIGNQRLLAIENIDISAYRDRLTQLHAQGKNALFVVENKSVIAMIIMEQVIKKNAKSTIANLKKRGVKHIKICTGSDRGPALCLANELGIAPENVHAEQTPEQKLALVRQCQLGVAQNTLLTDIAELDAIDHKTEQQKNKLKNLMQQNQKHVVAYVGDGGNDAIAMRGSNVSFAMNSGDMICKNNADVILPDHSLQPLSNCFAIAKQAMTNIKLNLAITIAFNLIMITIAAGAFIPLGFALTPAIAAAFMIGQALIVLFSAYCFKRMTVPGISQQKPTSIRRHGNKTANEFARGQVLSPIDRGQSCDYAPTVKLSMH